MQRQMLHGKIYNGVVTDASIKYEGSVTIDTDFLKAANILPGEKVLIANITNGARLESYALAGEAGSKTICLNGGAAKHGKKGDRVIIMTFALLHEDEIASHKPTVLRLDENNNIL